MYRGREAGLLIKVDPPLNLPMVAEIYEAEVQQ